VGVQTAQVEGEGDRGGQQADQGVVDQVAVVTAPMSMNSVGPSTAANVPAALTITSCMDRASQCLLLAEQHKSWTTQYVSIADRWIRLAELLRR
jgi:hypothetical protein